MPINYSEKQLLNTVFTGNRRSKRIRRLQMYAVMTGFLSTLVSFATLIVWIVK